MKKRTFICLLAAVAACVCLRFAPAKNVFANDNVTSSGGDFSSTITIVNENTDLSTPIVSGGEETYEPTDRVWQGCPNIMVTKKRIWATWYTGGTTEPRNENYCVIVYSEDGGKTWVDPYMIIDPANEKMKAVLPLFFLYENELWIIYYDYTPASGATNGGTYAIKSGNFDADNIADVTWSEPVLLFNLMIHHRPTVLSDGSLVVGGQGSDKTQSRVLKSSDGGKTWGQVGIATSDLSSYHKPKIVEKKDGTLWMLAQLEEGAGGGMEQSFSSNGGSTWTKYEYDLNPPLISPGARFEITRLKSGNLALVSYATTSARTDLTVYLSEDDGKTWNYSVLLDGRTEVSYPDLSQDDKGNIYIIWDMGRYLQKEMRMSIMTEADIRAGKISRKNESIVVSRLSDYRDIVEVRDVPENVEAKVGTGSKDIIADLPAVLKVVDDLGNESELKGRWVSKGYKADTPGVYVISFLPSSSGLVQDVHGLLNIRVTLTAAPKDDDGGCGASVGASVPLIWCVSALGLYFLKRRDSHHYH